MREARISAADKLFVLKMKRCKICKLSKPIILAVSRLKKNSSSILKMDLGTLIRKKIKPLITLLVNNITSISTSWAHHLCWKFEMRAALKMSSRTLIEKNAHINKWKIFGLMGTVLTSFRRSMLLTKVVISVMKHPLPYFILNTQAYTNNLLY